MMDFGGWLGRRTLIVGEAGSGKTRVLASFLDYLLERVPSREITVIDMAPRRVKGVGGLLEDYTPSVWRVRYLRPWKITPPRLTGRTSEEVKRYAWENREALEPLLEEYLSKPTPTLLINDITIYLHAGSTERIKQMITHASTFAATAYKGIRLQDDKGSSISRREREELERLVELMDQVVEV